MKLDELIEYLDYKDLINFKNIDITGISYNSKTTKKGDIFICLVGEHTDGHEYAQMAVDAGASALVSRALGTGLFGTLRTVRTIQRRRHQLHPSPQRESLRGASLRRRRQPGLALVAGTQAPHGPRGLHRHRLPAPALRQIPGLQL